MSSQVGVIRKKKMKIDSTDNEIIENLSHLSQSVFHAKIRNKKYAGKRFPAPDWAEKQLTLAVHWKHKYSLYFGSRDISNRYIQRCV